MPTLCVQEQRALSALLPPQSPLSLRCHVKGERGAWEEHRVYAHGMYGVNSATQNQLFVFT